MFFLLRMGFWLALVVLLLPLGLRGENGRDVSMFEALGAFQAVVADARGFCARQPEACAVGGQMVSHLMEKAQVGAKWLYEAVGEPSNAQANIPQAPAAQTVHPGLDPSAMPSAGQLQLTPQDLLPVWGGGAGVKPSAAAPRAPAAPAPGSAPLPPRRPA